MPKYDLAQARGSLVLRDGRARSSGSSWNIAVQEPVQEKEDVEEEAEEEAEERGPSALEHDIYDAGFLNDDDFGRSGPAPSGPVTLSPI